MLDTHRQYLDTVPRIYGKDCPLGRFEWLGVGLQVSEHRLGPRRRYKRFKCPVCKHEHRAILYAYPDPCCVRCAIKRGLMYSYQAKSPKREAAAVLRNQAGRVKSNPTAKRVALKRALEAAGPVADLDLSILSNLKKRALKT